MTLKFSAVSAINAVPQITVDSALSSTSTNPVQNKVISTALSNKMDNKAIDTTVTSGSSNLITSGAVYTAINDNSGGASFIIMSFKESTTNLYSSGPSVTLTGSVYSTYDRVSYYYSQTLQNVNRVNNKDGLILVAEAQDSEKNIVYSFYNYYLKKSSSSDTYQMRIDVTANSKYTFNAGSTTFVTSPNLVFEVDIGCIKGTDNSTSCYTTGIKTLVISSDSTGAISSIKSKDNYSIWINNSSYSYNSVKIYPDWSTVRISK